MFQNYLVTAWRNIVKNGIFSFINVFGLAVGLMSCILIMLFVQEETGFDNWLPDNERLVRMHTSYTMPNQEPFETVRSAGRMMEAIRDYAKNEIESGMRLISWDLTIQHQGNGFSERVTLVDGSFFDIFQLPFVHGSAASSFNKPMDMVITEAMAVKYFGRTDVIGETLTVCCVGTEATVLSITGVIKTLPDATHFNADMLVYLQPAIFGDNNNVLNTWTSVNVYTYFKLNQGVSPSQLQERVDYWMDNESPLVKMFSNLLGDASSGKKITDFVQQRIMAVPDLHLNAKQHAGNMGDLTAMGDANMIKTFIIVAGLVLLIACINFMNLSTAKAGKRAREVAMRKVLGASRTQVAIQFLGEAIAIVMLSLLFALVAVEIALPFYNEVLGKDLSLELFNDPLLLLSLVAIAVLVGIGAGLYPALYLSGFLPGHILRSSKGSESATSTKLRSMLVIFQFATSIVLVISTLVVYGQTMFSNNIDTGYQSNNKLVLNVRAAGDNRDSLKQQLLSIPEIESVVYSSEAPTQDNENNNNFRLLEGRENGVAEPNILVNYHNMGFGFFEAYKVEPIAGRLFSEAFGTDSVNHTKKGEIGRASIILNQSAVRKFGFSNADEAIGKTVEANVMGKQHFTIIGVVPDLYYRSIKFGVRATVYTLNPSRMGVASLSFNTDNMPQLIEKIEAVWKQNVPMQPINFQFLTEMMKAQYNDEVTTAQLFLVFSMLAIVVACLGLYGLSAFTVERRTKEIGIRKVMGASVTDIIKLLIWQFSKPVVIANIIAWPIAIYMMLRWLENFSYRIDVIWLVPICLGVGLLSLLIAWSTVGGNAAKVATKNPISSLRYE